MKAALRHPKARGELAEIQFLLMAAACGLIVCKPWGDSQPFDFVVFCKSSRRFFRIQVKSTACWQPRKYRVSTARARDHRRVYTRRDIDFLAAYVAPHDAWYLIPVRALQSRKAINLYPHNPASRGQFEKFRDAWSQLLR
jgi:hypothetical protein